MNLMDSSVILNGESGKIRTERSRLMTLKISKDQISKPVDMKLSNEVSTKKEFRQPTKLFLFIFGHKKPWLVPLLQGCKADPS